MRFAVLFEIILAAGLAFSAYLARSLRRDPGNWQMDAETGRIAFMRWSTLSLVCLIGAVCGGLLILGLFL